MYYIVISCDINIGHRFWQVDNLQPCPSARPRRWAGLSGLVGLAGDLGIDRGWPHDMPKNTALPTASSGSHNDDRRKDESIFAASPVCD